MGHADFPGPRQAFNYVVNSTTLLWEPQIQTGAGAGGGGSTQVSVKEILNSSGATVLDSTAQAVRVNVVAGSAAGDTTATVTPASTNFAAQSGFHFDSSGALNIAGAFSASISSLSSLAGRVLVDQNSSGWQVQPGSTNWPKAAGLSVDSSNVQNVKLDGSTALTIGAVAGTAGKLNIGSTAADNAVTATIAANQIVVAHNSTISDLLASVQQNSSVWQVQAGSTNWPKAAGLSVDSSNVQNVKLDGSTALTIGSIAAAAGRINVGSTAADNAVLASIAANQIVVAHNSTIGDLLASVQQNSTVWQVQAKIQDSSGVAPNIVGTRPSTNAQGFAVRTVLNDLQSTCFSTMGNNSTSNTVVSSVASQRIKVYAYSITSTAQAINTISFASSLGNPIWQVQMQAMSSGITGANLAVSPPAWLFATAAAEPLVWKCTGSTGSYHISFSYFTEA